MGLAQRRGGMQPLLSVLAENILELFPECTSTFRWHVTKEVYSPCTLILPLT